MSSAYYVVLEEADPGFNTYVNGKAIAKAAANLNRIARMLEIGRIEDYVSQDLSEQFDDQEEEFHGNVTDPHAVWFDANEGLNWATRLTEYIEANPGEVHDAEHVVENLLEYQQLFKNASEAGIRWHFEVDF